MYYTYVYSEPKTLVPFYVGKGHGDRANLHWRQGCSHNKHFNNKLQKLKRNNLEPNIQIIHVESEALAFELEKFLIQEIGRKDQKKGPLYNFTDGGEGTSGKIWSKEERQKLRDYNTPEICEEKRKFHKVLQNTPEMVEMNRAAQMQPHVREAFLKRVRGNKYRIGKKHKPEVVQRLLELAKEPRIKAIKSEVMKEYHNRPEVKERAKLRMIEMNVQRRGKIIGKQQIVICPHCGKQGGKNAMSHWHFDNCREISS